MFISLWFIHILFYYSFVFLFIDLFWSAPFCPLRVKIPSSAFNALVLGQHSIHWKKKRAFLRFPFTLFFLWKMLKDKKILLTLQDFSSSSPPPPDSPSNMVNHSPSLVIPASCPVINTASVSHIFKGWKMKYDFLNKLHKIFMCLAPREHSTWALITL